MGTDSYPSFSVVETAARLRDSLETVLWALDRIPGQWTHTLPDNVPSDSWTVAMNVGHLIVYDEQIAQPILSALASGTDGTEVTFSGRLSTPNENWFLNDSMAVAESPMQELTARLRSARDAQSDRRVLHGRQVQRASHAALRPGQETLAWLDRYEDVPAHVGARERGPADVAVCAARVIFG